MAAAGHRLPASLLASNVDNGCDRIMYRHNMMQPDRLRERLLEAFPGATLEVTDLTGTQDHYHVEIVAECFRGRTLIEQHRAVYRALGDALAGQIHALKLSTRTPTR